MPRLAARTGINMAVSYRIRGHAPHLPWFLRRLEARGLTPASESDLPARLPSDWTGIALADCWLDLARDGDQPLAQRQARCQAEGLAFIELSGDWQTLAAEHGFMLLAGCAAPPAGDAQLLLDALAPQAGCWLHCGPAHSARFCQRVFAALLHAGHAALPLPDGQPRALQWEQMLASQWQLADRLRQLAQAYLLKHLGQTPPYPAPLPPAAQHFAANLARSIMLALPDQQNWPALLEQLGAILAAHPPPQK
ncbi:hypothetical protein BI347_06835 [Chromobacterium sphagni]|uniref:Uncharacterized protein n=1 Tax=Chromobacterium sphagni TaxID=1903179 RepID=A0A1S1X154_9NEIS|nr:hypothetical protein [Chromobacterium sphagni]OHX13251.1 hypothetical protein BI347_06835 [Chromobacterium sphagni]